MNPRAWIWAVAGACLILVAAIVVGRGATHRPPRGPSAGAESGRTRPVPVVAVGHARRVQLPRTLRLTASIASLSQAVLYPKTSGYLQAVIVRPGDPVQAGQVVAVIDHAQLDAQLAQAQAQLAAAEASVQTAQAQVAAARAQRLTAAASRSLAAAQVANAQGGLKKAQAQLADAQATYNRTAELARQGAVAQQSLDDAKAQVVSAQAGVDSADAQVRAAQAQVAQADAQVQAAEQQEAASASQLRTQRAQAATQQAAVENARIQLRYATITAPFSGVVVSRQLDPGAYVTPGTSTPILTIADIDHLDVLVPISEADLPAVHRGDPVQIRVDAYPTRVFRGVVTRMAGGVDPATRTLQVEIDIANPGRLLRPGMYATAQLAAGTQPALVVPLSALTTVGGQSYVWVVTDGKVSQQPVTVGRATGDAVEITGGITPHDTIVVRGTDLVRQGQQVRAVPASP